MNAAPERRNPAGGPGFEEQHGHATGIARQAYRRRPADGTARAAILAELEAGRTLTSLEAWQRIGTSRLAADIHALRGMGWPIVAEELDVKARDGRAARVARYRLAEVAP